jgi:hypothetical protein
LKRATIPGAIVLADANTSGRALEVPMVRRIRLSGTLESARSN